MNKIAVNFAFLFGGIGFLFFLFVIIASFFGCCMGLTSPVFMKIVVGVLCLSVLIFAACMINNCSHQNKKD